MSLKLSFLSDPNSEESSEAKLETKVGRYVPYSDRKAFETINAYLQARSDVNLENTTVSLLEMMPDRDQHYHGRSGVPGMLVGCICDIAQQIPHDHSFQSKLLYLVENLSQSTKLHPLRESLGEALHEFDNGDFEQSIINPEPFQGHINLMAFKARLLTAKVWIFPIEALFFLSQALETRHTGKMESDSAIVGAATMWILYSCHEVFSCIRHNSPTDTVPNGPLYKGPASGLKRWQFWAEAFEEAVKYVNEESEKLTLQARTLMRTIERDISN